MSNQIRFTCKSCAVTGTVDADRVSVELVIGTSGAAWYDCPACGRRSEHETDVEMAKAVVARGGSAVAVTASVPATVNVGTSSSGGFAALGYRVVDPYAVTLHATDENGYDVTMTFARDLLLAGLTAVTGEGDVVVAPMQLTGDDISVSYRRPNAFGRGEVLLQRSHVAQFLTTTMQVVAIGSEPTSDLDAELAELLGA